LATEALELSGIDAYYGDSHVLHAVSFTLHGGRLLGLLGRNGAGKTTCMAAIMGFLKPRQGAIRLYGENVAGLAPDLIARKGICLVPQGRRMFRTRSSVSSSSFRPLPSATLSSRARSPVASSRCSRSVARSWAIRACY